MTEMPDSDFATFFLLQNQLPETFSYPANFQKIVKLGLVDLEPWGILNGELLILKYQGLIERYPNVGLIPFARRYDNDDVACWVKNSSNEVVIIHDYATIDYLFRERYADFGEWFLKAVKDMIDFE